MMKWLESRILWGSLLIIGGVLFLFQNLGWINFGGLFWAFLFGLGALFFFSIFFSNKINWWAIIPGMVLLSIGVVITLGYTTPEISADWSGSVMLGGIGLGFVLIFLVDQQQWWAIIPAGVSLSLAAALGLENIFPEAADVGGVFLMGLGFTFALVALVPTRMGRMRWPWIPAGILFLIGLLLTAITGTLLPYVLPLALIFGGGLLIYFTMRRNQS